MIYWLADNIIHGYIFATAAFLLLIAVYKPVRNKKPGFLNIANMVVLFGLLLNIVLVIVQVIECKQLEAEYWKENQSNNLAFHYTTSCYTPLLMALFLGAAFQSLFILKKYRVKVAATIVSILLLTVLQFFEKFATLITNLYRDYIPSSWSVYYSNWDIIWKFLSPVIYFSICWLVASGKLFGNRNNTHPAI